MKKFLFIALICILAVGLFAGTPRSYIQKLMYQATSGGALLPLPDVTNTSTTTATNYQAVAYLVSNPSGTLTTGVNVATTIRIYRGGNGGTVPYYGAFGLQLGSFPTPWVALDVVHVTVTYLPTMETCSWDMTIPDALTTTLQYTTDTSVIPYVLAPPYPAAGTPPPAASYVSPLDTATGISVAGTTLTWAVPVRDPATGYYVKFGTSATPPQVADQPGLTYPTGALAYNTTYHWQIVAYNTYGQTPGPVWSFTTEQEVIHTPPPAPVNISPANNAIDLSYGGQTLTWQEGAATRDLPKAMREMMRDPSTGYYVKFGTSATPPQVADQPGLTYNTGALVASTLYYWQIVAHNAYGETAGPLWHFTTASTPPVYWDVTITSNPTGQPIYVNGVNSTFVTPHPFSMLQGTGATYTVVNPLYSWDPPQFVVTNITGNMGQLFNGTLIPVYWNVTITSTPTGQPIYVNGVNSTFVTPHPFSMLQGTGATYTVVNPLYTWVPPQYVVSNITGNLSQEFVGTLIPVYWNVTITSTPTGQPIYVNGVNSTFVTPHPFSMLQGTGATYTVVNALYTWVPPQYVVSNITGNLSQEFVGTLIQVPPVLSLPANGTMNIPFGMVHLIWTHAPIEPGCYYEVYLGTTNPPAGPPVYTGTNLYYNPPLLVANTHYFWYVKLVCPTAAFNSPVWEFWTGDQMTPVELSSFTATVTSELFVNLTWVTQSETQVLGFNVYRSETNNVETSNRVNTNVIEAAGTSSIQHTYNLVDTEGLETNHTYYYWLENVDLTGFSTMYGPISALITEPYTPPVNQTSLLNNVYPNPFSIHANTDVTIDVTIKTGDTGFVTVYNLLGQVVKTFKVDSSKSLLTWNAKGSASGIYFIKLSTPTTNTTRKLVIVN
jgi:hypothetical protein